MLPVDALSGCASGFKGCYCPGGGHCCPRIGIRKWKTKALSDMTREMSKVG